VYGHEARSFRPCGRDDSLWAIEPGGLLWTLHTELTPHQEPYPGIFAVVEAHEMPAPTDGFGADYPGALRIEAVLYAGREGPGCEEEWSAFHYRVFGNEPFWSVEASDHRLRLSRLGHEVRFWHDISAERAADGARYIATEEGTVRAELTVTREPCRDSMSGAYYAYSAKMRIGEEELSGCALKGQIGR
jgi:putative lipoprotein